MVTSRTDPGLVLFGATRRRLLAWLFGHPDEAFYLRDLLRRTGAPEGAAQRELAALTAAGIVTRRVQGRQVYFQANRESPVFPELLSLLTKTTGLAALLREALASLAPRIRAAFVYGSAARQELRQGSDIDLMVVGDVTFGEVVDALRRSEERLGREVNPAIYPPGEFRTKLASGHHFVTSVLKSPMLFVVGGRDELEAVGTGQQMAGGARDVEGRDRQPARRRRPKPVRQPRGRSQR
jgi:predicted nucleotidyltransferase